MANDNARRVAEAEVDKAMTAGYLTPAMRDWAVALCTQDLGSFASFVASTTPAYAHLHRGSGLDSKTLPGPGRAAPGDAAAICAQLDLSPNGLKLPYAPVRGCSGASLPPWPGSVPFCLMRNRHGALTP